MNKNVIILSQETVITFNRWVFVFYISNKRKIQGIQLKLLFRYETKSPELYNLVYLDFPLC